MKLSTFILAGVVALAASANASDTFQAALAHAKQNIKTEAGAKYDEQFGMSFGSRVPDIMVECTKDAADDDLATFDIVARVASNGTLESVMVEPATKVAICLSGKMPRSEYPKPPAPHWWVFVNMKIK